MSFDPKIVPFERGADFIHQRAMKNLRDNNIVEALELMRRAVETSPENDDYRLELAQLLCDAGCPLSSNKLLLDMLVRNSNVDECLYGLAINQLNMNNPGVARKLLRMCSAKTENDELSAQAEQLTGELDMYEALNVPTDRRIERAYALTDEACERMQREDTEGAIKLFERSIELDNRQSDTHALLAMAYMMSGRTVDALKHVEIAAGYAAGSLRTLCISAQVYGMAQMDEESHKLLKMATEADPDPMEKRMLVFTLFEAGMYEEALHMARLALQETPCDKLLLHSMAVILLQLEEDTDNACGYWKRIMRIDPEDTVAEYYLKSAAENKLEIEELTCEYQVPRKEMMRRYLELADKMNRDLYTVAECWKEDEEFRKLLNWCMLSGDRRFSDAAVTLLASIEDDEAESRLREYLMRADSSFESVLRAAAMYRMRGGDTNRILPPHIDPADGMLPNADDVLEGMSVGHRQLVRLASEVLERRYGVNAYDSLAMMWTAYRNERGMRIDPLLRTETAAAALAYCWLLQHDMEPRLEKLAVQFGCGTRQLRFFVRHLMTILDKGGADDGSAD